MIWEYKDGKFTKKTEYTDVLITSIIQEILLWNNENPINIKSGVDYRSVFSLEVFLKQEVNNILEKYNETLDYFHVEESNIENNTITINITMSIHDKVIKKKLLINNSNKG